MESNMPNNNLQAVVTTFGATLLSVKHESNGKLEEITLNHTKLDDLINMQINPKYGATCGRTAGRIGKGKFSLPNLDKES
jgi:aldose 1-epimerase